MNGTLKSDLVLGLRELYKKDDAARRLLDGFAMRQKDSRMTPVSRATVLAGASHVDTVALLKKLNDLGAGEFVVGRRGSRTRIIWNFSVRSLGAAAQGAVSQPAAIDLAELEEPEADPSEGEPDGPGAGGAEWIEHGFQLRPDLRIAIRLPANLTSREAERLAGFIQQIPFGE